MKIVKYNMDERDDNRCMKWRKKDKYLRDVTLYMLLPKKTRSLVDPATQNPIANLVSLTKIVYFLLIYNHKKIFLNNKE